MIKFDRDDPIVFLNTLLINKKLKLTGLNAKAKKPADKNKPKKKEKFVLLLIQSQDVIIENFTLKSFYDAAIDKKLNNANAHIQGYKSPYEKDRQSLIEINRSDFIVRNGKVYNSLMHGILVTPDPEKEKKDDHLKRGEIKNIEGWDNQKDVVSLAGAGLYGHVKDVKVKNITCWNSADKGAVEVSDGTENIKVNTVIAYNSPYAVDIQDHYNPSKGDKDDDKIKKWGYNRHIDLRKIYATNCEYGIKTSNDDLKTANGKKGHSDLTVEEMVAENCIFPIEISYINDVSLSKICILDGPNSNINTRIVLENCDGKNEFRKLKLWGNKTVMGKALCVNGECVGAEKDLGDTRVKARECSIGNH